MSSAARLPAVLFDLDGTLLDSAPDFYAIISRLLEEHNKPAIAFTALKSEVSEGARAMIRRAFALHDDSPLLDNLLSELLIRYQSQLCEHATLFEGMPALLDQIEAANIPWGIVTNKPERFSQPTLDKLNLASRCKTLICPEHVNARKPDPESLLLACTQLNASVAHSIYIGDHIRDIEAGKRAGMFTIAALYGYIKEGEDTAAWQADYNVANTGQLWPIIQQLTSHYTI